MGKPSGVRASRELNGGFQHDLGDVTIGNLSLPAAVGVEDLLVLLRDLEADVGASERRLGECVRVLRERRATWREIGEALQISRQAAWERFTTR